MRRFSGSAVLRFSGSAVLRFSGSPVLRFCGSLFVTIGGRRLVRVSGRRTRNARVSGRRARNADPSAAGTLRLWHISRFTVAIDRSASAMCSVRITSAQPCATRCEPEKSHTRICSPARADAARPRALAFLPRHSTAPTLETASPAGYASRARRSLVGCRWT